jgi:putative membrane protein insertion efficiency factor
MLRAHTIAMNKFAEIIWCLPATMLIVAVRMYQWTLSPLIGRHCRFEPTCSAYFVLAVRKYGAIRGTWKGMRRIGRCHPWSPGGYDPP